ncbi:nitrous oxide-stimulated promoter family protein [Chloroflexota bacterium]
MNNFKHPRVNREAKTVSAMIKLYCRANHHKSKLCAPCASLSEYAKKRLEKCPFGEKKPTCANCTVHCYTANMRASVGKVMRYGGPRMIYRHPIMALLHLIDGRKKPVFN